MTVLEMVKQEAAKCGVALTDKEAEIVAWNYTGFPAFFAPGPDETNEDVMRRQVREWCARPEEKRWSDPVEEYYEGKL